MIYLGEGAVGGLIQQCSGARLDSHIPSKCLTHVLSLRPPVAHSSINVQTRQNKQAQKLLSFFGKNWSLPFQLQR